MVYTNCWQQLNIGVVLLLVSFKCFASAEIFEFGSAKSLQTTKVISEAVPFNSERGFGFDFDTLGNIRFSQHGFNAEKTVYFSVRLPEGRYQLDFTIGSDVVESNTTIKAESRRLLLNQLVVPQGKTQSHSVVIDVRSPVINATQQIALNDREKADLNWDNKLTLEFAPQSAIKRIQVSTIDSIPTLYLAGDSTVTDQDVEPWASWGQLITQYLNDELVVANYAVSGASLFSFKAEQRLAKILSLLKAGDYVFIQFAHNDEKRKGEGIGPWLSYSDLLREYVNKVRELGGIPVLLTPVQRRFFQADGRLQETHGDYPAAIRAVAKSMQVALIDLTQLSTVLYENWGDDRSRQAFVQYPANTFPNQAKALKDNTHFNYFGANEIALCVIKGIRDVKLPLRDFLRADAPAYDPRMPNLAENWTVPMSPRFVATQPDGS